MCRTTISNQGSRILRKNAVTRAAQFKGSEADDLRNATFASLEGHACTDASLALTDTVFGLVVAELVLLEARGDFKKTHRMKLKLAVSAFLADLLTAGGGWVHRSSKKDRFTGGPVGVAAFHPLQQALRDLGLIEHRAGVDHWSEGFDGSSEGLVTRRWAARYRSTTKLVALAAKHGITVASVLDHFDYGLPKEPLQKRAASKRDQGRKVQGRIMKFAPSDLSMRLEAEVRELNEYLATQTFGGGCVHRGYLRIFQNGDDPLFDWNRGGRLYTSGEICNLTTTTIVGAQYQLNYSNPQPVEGLHIPSHRPVATYNAISQIPTDPTTATQSYQQFQQLLAQVYGGGGGQNPGRIQKQSIISLAVFGEGNSSVQANEDLSRVFESFQEVLRRVMPPEIGFRKLEVRMPEVVCVTDSGDFSLDAMSGGVNSLFSIAWQIHMFGHDKERFVITIDEPENHLHPSMQRTLLPSLSAAFPKCSIIAATHSPFIVSSFPGANVYALCKGAETGRIVSEHLDASALSRTPNDVLREILDVSSNLPEWVESRIAQIVESTASGDTKARAELIMNELERLGLADALVEYKRGGLDAQGN